MTKLEIFLAFIIVIMSSILMFVTPDTEKINESAYLINVILCTYEPVIILKINGPWETIVVDRFNVQHTLKGTDRARLVETELEAMSTCLELKKILENMENKDRSISFNYGKKHK